MNERIQKLKESACPKIDWVARYHVELNNGEKEKWMNEWFEKFAEMIVRECIQLCQECIDDGCVEAQEPMGKIREHFGVEE